MAPSGDPWRPRVHFSAQRHWINDPNGLIWHDGEYHLFFQYNPEGDQWGHMSWGHAVSADLFHWRELPVAIAEDAQRSAFSGSAVIDRAHTAGFGDGGTPAMVAAFTAAARTPPYHQSQHLAFSLDRGRHFQPVADNPVLDIGSTEFRDPKVFWHAPTARWVMLVSHAVEGRLGFYTSDNLRQWQPASDWRIDLPPGCRVWECPDLTRLPVDAASTDAAAAGHAWLLKVDVCEGHPAGRSGALVVVGDFDGRRFEARQAPQWIDGGRDFYAAITFAEMPPGDARRVAIGWMSDHAYARATPSTGWRGAMTLPREWRLAPTPQGLHLVQQPVRELQALRGTPQVVPPGPQPAGRVWLVPPGALPVAADIELAIDAGQATAWAIGLRASADGQPFEATRVGIDRDAGVLFIDRRDSGVDLGLAGYAGLRRLAWADARQALVRLRIVVDACSVEVFSDDGQAVLTELVFPGAASTGIWLQADAPVVLRQLVCWPLDDAMGLA